MLNTLLVDIVFAGTVVGGLTAIFAGLSAWQRSIDRAERHQTLAKLQEADALGTRRAAAQFPQIKPYLCIGCGSCVRACPEEGVLGLVNGIAHVIQGNHCVGHARCQEACPVGAITVGLGELKARPDIPVLSESLESSQPGVFIAGELGGLALIRHAIDQGRRAAEAAAAACRAHPAGRSETLDLLIIGAGPAGIAASLRAKELGLTFQTLSREDAGGTIRKYPRRKLTLVQEVRIPLFGVLRGQEYTKEDLVRLWDQLIQTHQLPLRTGIDFTGLKRQGQAWEAQTSAGIVAARCVILALGRRGTPRRLGVPGEDLEKVLYHLIDTASYRGQRVLVVGGGDSAIEAATGLADQTGNVVHLSYRRENFSRLKARNEKRIADYVHAKRLQVIFNSQVQRIERQTVTLAVDAAGQSREVVLPNEAVFIFAGGDPPFGLLKNIGIRFGGDPAESLSGHARWGS